MFYGGVPVFGADLNNFTGKIVARGIRGTPGGAGTVNGVESGVLRVDDVDVVGGCEYTVRVMCHPASPVLTDTIRVTVRHTIDGTVPTTSSAILPGARVYDRPSPSLFETDWIAPADGVLSLILCVAREAGTGTATLFADADRWTEMKVFLGGLAVPDTGVPV